MKQTVHIIGSTSYIGKYLKKQLDHKYKIVEYSRSVLKNFNLENYQFDTSLIKDKDICLFLASLSSPDFCERNKGLAFTVNLENTTKAIEAILKKNAKVVFFSTDAVYGEGDSLTEESNKSPIGVYGRTKLELENKFINHPRFLTLRLSHVFGGDKFSNLIIQNIEDNETTSIFSGFYRSLTPIEMIGEFIQRITDSEHFISGAINLSDGKKHSRENIVNLIERSHKLKASTQLPPPASFFDSRARTTTTKTQNI